MDLILGIGLGVSVSTFILLIWVRKRIEIGPHQAMLSFRRGSPSTVYLHDRTVIPFFEEIEIIDLSTQGQNWSFQGKSSLRCKDHRKAQIELSLFFGLPKDSDAILEAAKQLGSAKLQDPDVLSELISPSMKEAITEAVAHGTFQNWVENPSQLSDRIIAAFEIPISGMQVEKISIVDISPCPEAHYDHTDLRDFEAILSLRKERTDLEAVQQQIEDAEAVVLEAKEKQKEMMKEQLEVQRLRKALDLQFKELKDNLERFKRESRVQLDILRSDLDMKLGDFRTLANQSAAAKGKTIPKSIDIEISKLRMRKRAESDLLHAENERIAIDINKQIDGIDRA